jgi:hypothetical protein
MATLNLTVPDGPETVRNETLGTAGNVRLVQLPPTGRYLLTILPRVTALKYIGQADAAGLTENQAIGSTPYLTIPVAGAELEIAQPDRTTVGRTIGLACTNSSEVVEIQLVKVIQ